MILQTKIVKQNIDLEERAVFRKDIVMTPGQPIGMVRKRLPDSNHTSAAVILIHGFGQNRYTWHTSKRSLVNYLASAGLDVFNMDLRGHGRSLDYDSARAHRITDFIEHDIPRCVDEVQRLSGHQRVFLVGHSMGGLIAMAAASTHLRKKVAGIVTLGSPYSFGGGSKLLEAFSRVVLALRATGLLDRNVHFPLKFLGDHLKRRMRLWDSRLFRFPIRPWRPGSVEEEVLSEYLQKSFDLSNFQVAFDIFGGRHRRFVAGSQRGQVDYSRAFESLNVPLLAIAGSEDDLAPPESVRPAYALSGSRDKMYRVFPCGHIDIVMGREATETIWPLLRGWLLKRAEQLAEKNMKHDASANAAQNESS